MRIRLIILAIILAFAASVIAPFAARSAEPSARLPQPAADDRRLPQGEPVTLNLICGFGLSPEGDVPIAICARDYEELPQSVKDNASVIEDTTLIVGGKRL